MFETLTCVIIKSFHSKLWHFYSLHKETLDNEKRSSLNNNKMGCFSPWVFIRWCYTYVLLFWTQHILVPMTSVSIFKVISQSIMFIIYYVWPVKLAKDVIFLICTENRSCHNDNVGITLKTEDLITTCDYRYKRRIDWLWKQNAN